MARDRKNTVQQDVPAAAPHWTIHECTRLVFRLADGQELALGQMSVCQVHQLLMDASERLPPLARQRYRKDLATLLLSEETDQWYALGELARLKVTLPVVQTETTPQRRVYCASEAQKVLGIGPSKFYWLVETGHIESIRSSTGRQKVYTVESVDRLKARQEVA